jgi:hypothetical protein
MTLEALGRVKVRDVDYADLISNPAFRIRLDGRIAREASDEEIHFRGGGSRHRRAGFTPTDLTRHDLELAADTAISCQLTRRVPTRSCRSIPGR